ncbi:MAG: hypothetical protein IJR54_04750 [Oscillibacter sp.]|nr:hypothetical protein [Oscillibacter sp.]
MQRIKLVCAALTLCAAILTGCGGGGGTAGTETPDKGFKNDATAYTMEDLIEAVKPGADIVLNTGYYNLSDYVNEIWLADEAESFNATHEYVQIVDCYDGAEVVFQNADNLSIRGAAETAYTEIVIEPRYGTVFTFSRCDNLKLSNLTLGHTDTGECSGSVVELSACENAELRELDLYGCGVVALECSNGTEGVSVHDSALRDCSWGPLGLYDAVGKIDLYNCSLTGSEGGGYYNSEGRLELSFHNCVFGEEETYYWEFAKGVEFEDCTWNEPDGYPYEDYYDDENQFDESMVVFQTDALEEAVYDMSLTDSSWTGYSTLNPDTDASTAIPSGEEPSDVSMDLRADGSGVLNGYYEDRAVPFLWEPNADNPAKLDLVTLHDGAFQITTYQVTAEDILPRMWIALRTPDGVVWMY